MRSSYLYMSGPASMHAGRPSARARPTPTIILPFGLALCRYFFGARETRRTHNLGRTETDEQIGKREARSRRGGACRAQGRGVHRRC